MPNADDPPRKGSTLGDRYLLAEEIGHGGMGVVHRARDLRLGRDVAVKILRNMSGRERFRLECETLGRLSHPGLVAILDADLENNTPYLVMELVDGEPLTERIAAGPLDAHQVTAMGASLADALAHVHRHRIVHRDVKPANVLVAHDGRVKLADFGVARLLDVLVRHTDTGMVMGTAAYLAPEQVRGQAATVASDVYALGLVLIEALTGERAYPGTWEAAAVARLTTPPPIDPFWPHPLPQILTAMTDAEPARRPSAAEVAAALLTPVAGRPAVTPVATSTASTASTLPTVPRPALRSRPAALLTAAAALVTVPLLGVHLSGATGETATGTAVPAAVSPTPGTASSPGDDARSDVARKDRAGRADTERPSRRGGTVKVTRSSRHPIPAETDVELISAKSSVKKPKKARPSAPAEPKTAKPPKDGPLGQLTSAATSRIGPLEGTLTEHVQQRSGP